MSFSVRKFLTSTYGIRNAYKVVFFSPIDPHRAFSQSQFNRHKGLTKDSSNTGLIPICNNYVTEFRNYSTAGVKETSELASERKKKEKIEGKKKESPKILLIDEKGSITKLSLEDAGALAKKRRLQLIEVDPITENLSRENQVYKLMTSSEFYGEDVKHRHHKPNVKDGLVLKDDKTVLMKSTTNEHDVIIKVKQITKWVQKSHPVKILIGQPGDKGSPENVYKIIENAVKDQPMRIIQKVAKNGQIKFQILPPKELKSSEPKAKQPTAKKPEKEPVDSE